MLPDFFDNEDHEDFAAVHEAFYCLLPAQQQVLRLYYEEYYSYEDISSFYKIEKYEAKARVDRAVYALTGGVNHPEGDELYESSRGQWDTRSKGRRAMSNAAARRLTNGAWE